jgi:hypothetical protein
MPGYIYILSNPAFPNLIKIGKSERDPVAFRASELYTTGVPHEFVVEYCALMDDYHFVEQECHRLLIQFRPNKSREFFNYSVPEAISVIRRTSRRIKSEMVFHRTAEEIRRAEEQHSHAMKLIAEREERQRKKQLADAQLRAEKRRVIEENRRVFIAEKVDDDLLSKLLGVVFGVLTILLLLIGFGDGIIWPFFVTALMWGIYWAIGNSVRESARREAEIQFPGD